MDTIVRRVMSATVTSAVTGPLVLVWAVLRAHRLARQFRRRQQEIFGPRRDAAPA